MGERLLGDFLVDLTFFSFSLCVLAGIDDGFTTGK